MKITVYTINDCQFSKAEKDYLQAHNLPYEEKNLESNKEFLTEMLALSNNFAGTPVTKIEKDDGQISVLKGFTKEEFDKLTGVTQEKTAVVNSTMDVPTDKPAAPVQTPQPAPVSTPQAPTPAPVPTTQTQSEPPKEELVAQTSPQPEPEQPKQNEALNSVLNNLQQASGQETQAQPPAQTQDSAQQGAALPNVPEPDFK